MDWIFKSSRLQKLAKRWFIAIMTRFHWNLIIDYVRNSLSKTVQFVKLHPMLRWENNSRIRVWNNAASRNHHRNKKWGVQLGRTISTLALLQSMGSSWSTRSLFQWFLEIYSRQLKKRFIWSQLSRSQRSFKLNSIFKRTGWLVESKTEKWQSKSTRMA